MKQKFSAIIEIVDINLFVPIPDQVLYELQKEAKKDKMGFNENNSCWQI